MTHPPDSAAASHGDARRAPDRDFDPEAHRADLLPIVRAIVALPEGCGEERVPHEVLEQLLRAHPREGRGFFSRAQLIAGYRHFASVEPFAIDEAQFVRRVQLRPVRTQSGVTPLTVLTKPYPCPGRCVFCPNDVRMPKSYLSDEPGAQRAAVNHFDPYLQTWNRLDAYRAIGHPVEKVEMIVLGGTWSSHPEPYQVWFVKRCFDALNDFGAGRDGRASVRVGNVGFGALSGTPDRPYNDTVGEHLRATLDGQLLDAGERAAWGELEEAQRENETAGCRSVGFVVETRPDHLTQDEVTRIRRLGCTKVQIGYQSLDDGILALNARGHDVAATRRAMRLLRSAGFKIHAHWMPNLLGATPASDIEDFERLFSDPDFRPDELKIYPCSLIETAELMDYHRRGEWSPYTHEELLHVVSTALGRVPRYCRVTRVIRDISSDDIVVGNKLTNFRQIAEKELARRGGACRDIRAREIRGERFDANELVVRTTEYASCTGVEHFIEFTTAADRICGFVRLALPDARAEWGIEEIRGSALIREVHIYGASLELGSAGGERAQHRGLGQRLMALAEETARTAGYAHLAVISAVGTRPYYRRFGFEDGSLYQHKRLDASAGERGEG